MCVCVRAISYVNNLCFARLCENCTTALSNNVRQGCTIWEPLGLGTPLENRLQEGSLVRACVTSMCIHPSDGVACRAPYERAI